MAGTALGIVDNPTPSPNDPPPPNGTIFDQLEAHGISWKNYFVDLPTTGLFSYQLTKYLARILPVADFFVDAALGTLPGFSLIDPEATQALAVMRAILDDHTHARACSASWEMANTGRAATRKS